MKKVKASPLFKLLASRVGAPVSPNAKAVGDTIVKSKKVSAIKAKAKKAKIATFEIDGAIVGEDSWFKTERDVSGKDLRSFLKSKPAMKAKKVLLLINSPGGDALEGFAMANAVREYQASGGEVSAMNIGKTMSAATMPYMASEKRYSAKNALFMYHGGWTVAIGGVKALTRTAKLLGKIDTQMAELLAEVTGEDADELMDAMQDEDTYLTPKEAVEFGLADAIVDGLPGAEEKDDDEDEDDDGEKAEEKDDDDDEDEKAEKDDDEDDEDDAKASRRGNRLRSTLRRRARRR